MLNSFLKYVGRQVYGSVFPGVSTDGAESYLIRLKSDAPFRVFLIQVSLVLFVWFYLMGCDQHKREARWKKLLSSSIYPLRLIGYAVRGHALIAQGAGHHSRGELFGESIY